jgi:uncharacterized protein (TIGR02270 family)
LKLLEDVIEEHAEEAAFLWQQRDMAVRAPDFDLDDVMEWDERVEAHLDGLLIAGETGWQTTAALGFDDPGEFFIGLWLAIALGKKDCVDALLLASEDNSEAHRAMISALGWLTPDKLQGVVKALLSSDSPHRHYLGIGACAVHRVNPGKALDLALKRESPALRARGLKAIGELGLIERITEAESDLDHPDSECRFWASWSAGLLGSDKAINNLKSFAITDGSRRRAAVELVIKLMPLEAAHSWIRELAAQPDGLRWALMSAGYLGDPFYLEPVMKQFTNDKVAQVAGEAFENITGLSIYEQSLEIIPETVPNDEEENDDQDGDDSDQSNDDAALVIPDPEKMAFWYTSNHQQFPAGQRLNCGKPISRHHLAHVLRSGKQRQRRSAAIDLAIINRGAPLFETRAKGQVQLESLEKG